MVGFTSLLALGAFNYIVGSCSTCACAPSFGGKS